MKLLTDEQYLNIWRAAMGAPEGETSVTRRVNMGRAAYEAAHLLLMDQALAEPTVREWGEASTAASLDEVVRAKDGKAFLSCRAVGKLLANRLAHLNADIDPAVRAVSELMRKWPYGPELSGTLAMEMVAAVRAADEKAGRA